MNLIETIARNLAGSSLDPFPPSAGGSGLLYFFSLGSITLLAFAMAAVAGWMMRDIWRDRYHVHPSRPLFAFRMILFLASSTSSLRAFPEAAYLYLWGEAEPEVMATVLLWKRIADAFAFLPGAGWAALLALAYPAIVFNLQTSSYATLDLVGGWRKLVRPIVAGVLIMTIAALVAIDKAISG